MTNSRKFSHEKLHEIEMNIEKLKDFLMNIEFQKTNYYKTWYKEFVKIYGKKFTNIRLYILAGILYSMGYLFFITFIKNEDETFNSEEIYSVILNKEVNIDQDLFNLNYFNQFFKIFTKGIINSLIEIFSYLIKSIQKSNIAPEFTFDYLIQNFLSPLIRHRSGEFYTPPFLVKKMTDLTYEFGNTVLDPSCGSGNFLIEIIKTILSMDNVKEEKVNAINKIFGYDINPLSIFFAKLSFLYLINQKLPEVKFNLYLGDSLFQNDLFLKNKFDLVIGNPPWYTLREIDSIGYQNKIKSLAEHLGIKPSPKNVLNIEISALFFYRARDYFMKDKGKIFFVITKGVINGSHTSRFRNFKGFNDVKIWLFNKKIEKLFNIEFICLYARKSDKNQAIDNLIIPAYLFSTKSNSKSLKYFKDIPLIKEKLIQLVPYAIERKRNDIRTKKLISQDEKKILLPIRESYYNKLFHKGADLNPRNLIFVTFKNENNVLVKINPDERIFKRAKSPWNKKEFKNELVEKRYIYNVVKSTELIKFLIYDYYYVFLPLEKENLTFDYTNMGKNAKQFYDKINQIYLNKKKSTTKNKSLMDNLDRWAKLRNTRQRSNIKVVYNNSGSVLNSAVIKGEFLVTGDLSFFGTNNLNEAYYLNAILNSSLINKQVRIKKSSRHIFKLPFETPIKKYMASSKNHRELAELAKKAEFISKQTIDSCRTQGSIMPSKIKIQKILKQEIKPLLNQIDKILEIEFGNEGNSKIIH